jgi:hypothetical protein
MRHSQTHIANSISGFSAGVIVTDVSNVTLIKWTFYSGMDIVMMHYSPDYQGMSTVVD